MCSTITKQRKPSLAKSRSNLDKLELFDKMPSTTSKLHHRKWQTVDINSKLAALNSNQEKTYKRACFCANVKVVEGDGKVRTTYCKARSCLTCQAIRKAYLIDRYKKVLEECKDLHFVTLTVRNVPSYSLRKAVKDMKAVFVDLKRKAVKIGLNTDFLRALETTSNAKKNTFHPHFHILVDGKIEAEFLKSEWIKQCVKRGLVATPKGQDLKKADSGSAMELLKYVTKLEVKTDEDIKALDTIFTALAGLRIVEPYGKFRKLKVNEDEAFADLEKQESLSEMGAFTWNQDILEWINTDTGECLVMKRKDVAETFKEAVPSVQRE